MASHQDSGLEPNAEDGKSPVEDPSSSMAEEGFKEGPTVEDAHSAAAVNKARKRTKSGCLSKPSHPVARTESQSMRN